MTDNRSSAEILAALADQWEAGDVDPDMVGGHVAAMIAEIRALDPAGGCTCCQTHSYPGMADRYPAGECGRCGHLYRRHNGQ